MTYDVVIADQVYRVELQRDSAEPNAWSARVNGRELRFNAVPAGRDVLSIVLGGRSYEVLRENIAGNADGGATVNIVIGGMRYPAELRDPRALRSRRAGGAQGQGPRKIVSPMPGKVVRLLVAEGAQVSTGSGVLVLRLFAHRFRSGRGSFLLIRLGPGWLGCAFRFLSGFPGLC